MTKDHLFDKQAFCALGGIVAFGIALPLGFTATRNAPSPPPVIAAPASPIHTVRSLATLDRRLVATDRQACHEGEE
jgi:hypothetical protein